MRKNSPFARIGLLLLALLPAACRVSDEAPLGKTTLSIDADAFLLQRDSVVVILKASNGADTLFQGKLSSLDTLRHLPASGYDGGRALIIIRGFQGGQLVYEERRDYNGAAQRNLIVDVPLDLTASTPRSSLDLRPDRLKLFLGGRSVPMQAYPPESWKDKSLAWTIGDSAVATVSQSGEVTPAGLGVTYVRATSGDTASDASSIAVVLDPPVLDIGSDTTLAVGTAVTFHVRVKQEYGDVAELAWDLDGDGTYEGTVAGVPGQTDLSTPARTYVQTGVFTVHVRVRDGEGNVAFASKKVKVGATAPALDSLTAAPYVVSIKDAVSFKALASGGGVALETFAWDFDGDGKADQSGELRGDTATLATAFNYPDAKIYKATLRITDAEGGSITASAQITVKLDRPAANAGVDFSVAPSAQVVLRGRAMDTLGRIVTQEWKIGAENFAPAADSGTLTFTAPVSPGNVICVFRAIDDDGLAAEDTMIVTINDGKAPSIASFIPHDTIISIKDELPFAAQAEAVDGNLKSWTLDVNGDGIPEAQGDLSGRSQPIRAKRVFHAPGAFDVTLKIVDMNGKSTAAKARVTVLLDVPTADAGPDTNNVAPGSRVNLHGSAKDSLGAIVRMEWKFGSGTYVVMSKGDTSITAPAAAGAYNCVFRVMDDDSLVDSNSMIVNVKASANADLSKLALSAGLLAPGFVLGRADYTTSVSNATDSIKVTPLAAGDGSSIKVNAKAVASGTASDNIPLNVGPNTITINVTAQDGTTKKTYTVTVTRLPNANADLLNLVTTPGPASPVFAPATIGYSLTVPYSSTSISVTATVAASTSTLKVKTAAATSGTAVSVNLTVGANSIPVEVTAQDGTTKKTYTLTVTRMAASTNAGLSALAVPTGVTIDPSFSPTVLDYDATATASVAALTLQPTAADANATITVDGSTVASGSKSANLTFQYGTSSHTIVVTAQDGVTKQTYNFSIWRPGSADFITGYALITEYSGSYQLTNNFYNPGGTVKFTKVAKGTYTVTFRGLGTLGNSEGIVHATAYGGFPTYCKVVSTSNSGGDLAANIACFSYSGVVSDSYLSVIAEFPRSAATGPSAYAVADSPTTDSYFPSPTRSYSSTGAQGSIVITRMSEGVYHFLAKGMDLGNNESGGAMVTAYGPGNIRCELGPPGSQGLVYLYCMDPATGDRKDSPFSVSYSQVVSGSTFGVGWALGGGETLPDIDNSSGFNTGGGAIKHAEIIPGSYRITFVGLGAQGGTRPSNVQVSPSYFGGNNTTCQVEGWSGSPDLAVDVSCWDNTGARESFSSFNIRILK